MTAPAPRRIAPLHLAAAFASGGLFTLMVHVNGELARDGNARPDKTLFAMEEDRAAMPKRRSRFATPPPPQGPPPGSPPQRR